MNYSKQTFITVNIGAKVTKVAKNADVLFGTEVRKPMRYSSSLREHLLITPGQRALPCLSGAVIVQSPESACRPPGPFSRHLNLADTA